MKKALTGKSYESFNFKQYSTYDVSEIKKEVMCLTASDWLEDSSRQTTNMVLQETEAYFIFQSDARWSYTDPFISELVCKNKKLCELVEPIIKDLEAIHDGVRGRVMFTRLDPNKVVPTHYDSGNYLFAVRRNHVTIITDPQVIFCVNNENIHMKEGECWEINNSKPHSVSNESSVSRVHLIIDVLPNSEKEK